MPTLPSLASQCLVSIYRHKFKGESNCSYIISKKKLKRILCRESLKQSIVDELHDELSRLGFVLIHLDSRFAIQETATVLSCREVEMRTVEMAMRDNGIDGDV